MEEGNFERAADRFTAGRPGLRRGLPIASQLLVQAGRAYAGAGQINAAEISGRGFEMMSRRTTLGLGRSAGKCWLSSGGTDTAIWPTGWPPVCRRDRIGRKRCRRSGRPPMQSAFQPNAHFAGAASSQNKSIAQTPSAPAVPTAAARFSEGPTMDRDLPERLHVP